MLDPVKKTFKILEDQYGVDYDFLYQNAETKESFNISLQGLCDKLKIKIMTPNNLTDENGKRISGKSDCEHKIIYINGSDIGERMSFTLGHELYHILNNQNENRDEDERFKENELNANAFSAELLMPVDILVKKIKEFKIDILMLNFGFGITELAKYFQVSYPAMCVRLFNLGLISSL